MKTAFKQGQRVRLIHAVDRYPHFLAPAGATGTVVEDGDLVRVRMHAPISGADPWNNEIEWYLPNDDDPTRDLEVIPVARRKAGKRKVSK